MSVHIFKPYTSSNARSSCGHLACVVCSYCNEIGCPIYNVDHLGAPAGSYQAPSNGTGVTISGTTYAFINPGSTAAMTKDESQRAQEDEVVAQVESWPRSKRKMIYSYLNHSGERLDNCSSYDIDRAFKEEWEKARSG